MPIYIEPPYICQLQPTSALTHTPIPGIQPAIDSTSSHCPGGLSVRGGQAVLKRCTVKDCSSVFDGGGIMVGGSMDLVSSTIFRCTAPERGSAIRALAGCRVLVVLSEVTECSGHLNGAINVAGQLTLANDSRISGCSTREGSGAGGGGLAIEAGGAALLVKSDILSCREWTGWTGIHGGGAAYVSAKGALQLIDVRISDCIGTMMSTAITVSAYASLTATRLMVTPPCNTAWDDISEHNPFAKFLPPAIYAHPDAQQFSLSELRVMMPKSCNMSDAELVTNIVVGIEDWTVCQTSTCGPAADCTLLPMLANSTTSTYVLDENEPCRSDICRDQGQDADCCNSVAGGDGVNRSCRIAGYVPYPGGVSSLGAGCNADYLYQCCPQGRFVMNISTPTCTCHAPLFPVPDSTTTAPFLDLPLDTSLVPFFSGCASPRQVGSASVVGETTASVVVELNKDGTRAATKTVTIALHMIGHGGAPSSWSIDPTILPSWLALKSHSGTIASATASIEAVLDSSGVAERAAAYDAKLPFYVRSQQDASISVPVLLTVTASVVAARSTWGAVDAGALCSQAAYDSTALISQPLREALTLPFTACDLDGLPVAHQIPSNSDARAFSVSVDRQHGVATSSDGAEYTVGVHYIANGRYELRLELLMRRNFTVTLLLGDADVGTLRISGICPRGETALLDGQCGCSAGTVYKTSTMLCVLCETSTWSQPGAATCLPCPADSTTAAQGSADITQCLVKCGLQTRS